MRSIPDSPNRSRLMMTVQEKEIAAREHGYSMGTRDEHDRIVKLFQGWTMTHPDETVRDELWGFLIKLREGERRE
jgi:hypothetical protein